MDVTYSMVSVNTGEIRENNRRDIVINYCKTLDTDFPILQKTLINFSHLHDIRKLWDREVIISPGKKQTCGVLLLAKRTAPPIEQIITNPAGRYVFFKIKNTADAALPLYAPLAGTMKGAIKKRWLEQWRNHGWNSEGAMAGTMKERLIDRQIFIRKIKKLLYKKITHKNNLILLGHFNMTLGNKDRSTGNKGFCVSQ